MTRGGTVIPEGHRYQMHQSYRFPYVVLPHKLTRLVEVISQRLQHGDTGATPHVEASTKNGVHVSLPDVSALFQLDNSVANPLETVSVHAGDIHDPAHVQVIFSRAPRLNVVVDTASVATTHALYAEIDEQLERMRVQSWVYLVFSRGPLVALAVCLTALLLFLGSLSVYFGWGARSGNYPTPSEAERLLAKFKQSHTLEDRVAALAAAEQATLEHAVRRPWWSRLADTITLANTLFLAPFIIAVVAIMFAVRRCYPRAVFAWGDWAEHYRRLVQMRERLWGIVFGSFLIGALASMLAARILAWFAK